MQFDVIIVGAGVVGLSLALELGQAGLKIAILEKQAIHQFNQPLNLSEYDLRVFAINWASQQVFESLKVWDIIKKYRVSPYKAMQVWDSIGTGQIEFDSYALLESELGHIIEQKVILKALWEKIQEVSTIQLFTQCELIDLTLNPILSNLYCQSPDFTENRLQASLIVGADGPNSWVREQAGLKTRGWSYQQSALVATIETEKPHGNIARQRFAPNGPLALLPLDNPNQCSIVWMTKPEIINGLKNQTESEFSESLTQSFGSSLGKLILSNPTRAVFPLKMQQAIDYCRPGCAIVGDAAQVIHPLAGMGVNLGLHNAKTLADLIKIQKDKNRALGDLIYLKQYERHQKIRSSVIIAAMEAFKRGFGTDNTFVTQLRGLGLNFVNKHSILKKRFIDLAMGK